MGELKKIMLVLAVAASLGGCGFKSDLIAPDEKPDTDDLFISDGEVLDERPPFLPADPEVVEVLTDDDIVIDKVTTVASDGEILVNPDLDGAVDSEDPGDSESNNTGVPVDFSDLTRQLEGNN